MKNILQGSRILPYPEHGQGRICWTAGDHDRRRRRGGVEKDGYRVAHSRDCPSNHFQKSLPLSYVCLLYVAFVSDFMRAVKAFYSANPT